MNQKNLTSSSSKKKNHIKKIVDKLCTPESYELVYHRLVHEVSMPSIKVLSEIVETLRSVLFPGYFGNSELNSDTMTYYLGSTIDHTARLLSDQIMKGFCFACKKEETKVFCQKKSEKKMARFLSTLPKIRQLLATDVKAAFYGDPATKNMGEIIFCYPSIKALTSYRIAHELYCLDVPVIPRIITEMAHSETGIDIHPGAKIGEHFFMDHGTGVVIGETTIIGNNVRLYQGVTLGAKSFPMDKDGNPVKNIPRHPIVEDNVIIYSGATILGRVKIGKGSVIGGNVWVTHDIPPKSNLVQRKPRETLFENGSGI